MGRAAGLLVELARLGRAAQRVGLAGAAAIRPGDHAGQRAAGGVQRQQAVHGAPQAERGALFRAHPGLSTAWRTAAAMPSSTPVRVLLVPALLGAASGVIALPEAQDAPGAVHHAGLARARAQIDTEKE